MTTVPGSVQQQPTSFDLHIDEQKLQDFKTLLKLSPVAKETFENQQNKGGQGKYGISRKWIVDAKKEWMEGFDWRMEEDSINSFPNFKTMIHDDDGSTYDIHFVALFSKRADAIPVAFYHGWPGSFLEFIPLMNLLRKKYTEDNLPYHIIAPSLPGFGLSSDPPLQKDWKLEDVSRVMHKHLVSLGFSSTGYLVQGGDIGSLVARQMAATYAECKGMHLNFMFSRDIKSYSTPEEEISEAEKKGIERMNEFMDVGRSYADQHATKPSTIGLVLSSSPLAHLAWIGEKFLAWSDPSTTPTLHTILADITLYWLTGCYPTSIYTYREAKKMLYVDKPVGYSWFPYELCPVPKAWAEKTGNLVFFRAHEKGGHFAALERPGILLEDVEEWVKVAWK
ncbi:epoxide hydrolase [Pyrenophora seminiperda CCB06]|uniref:Epoxide hydrolase n=1 Tax=Pyrenophora seminiperda CCB06 TaxID=1302712 RepID=A0A3M7M8S9_9PLEO|nr:epoxide hydrolase [Pyrenophora seminiperda CCB06]